MEELVQSSVDPLIEQLRSGTPPAGPVDLRQAMLAGMNLSGANLAGADLQGADLQGADLSGARLFKANLSGANLSGANLERAELSGADLTEANLEAARMENAGLGMAVLRNAKLFRANMRSTTLSQADLTGADLRCAGLESARILEARLEGADFTGADLREADLSKCVVRKALFVDADLRDAKVSGLSEYEKANWVGADMRGVDFSGAYLLRRFAMDQNYIKEFRESSRLAGYVYYLWWISSDCGRSISRWLALVGLIALLFAGLYELVDISYGNHEPSWFLPIYYSLVTMTTLGYGDIVPVSVPAQMIAMLQVLIGYIMLGGLLSIFSNKLARRAE